MPPVLFPCHRPRPSNRHPPSRCRGASSSIVQRITKKMAPVKNSKSTGPCRRLLRRPQWQWAVLPSIVLAIAGSRRRRIQLCLRCRPMSACRERLRHRSSRQNCNAKNKQYRLRCLLCPLGTTASISPDCRLISVECNASATVFKSRTMMTTTGTRPPTPPPPPTQPTTLITLDDQRRLTVSWCNERVRCNCNSST